MKGTLGSSEARGTGGVASGTRDHTTYELLGVPVSAISFSEALAVFERWLDDPEYAGPARYVCITSVHGIMESQRDPEVLRIHREAAMVTPDGMPLVWLGRRAGFRNMTRVYGPDLMREICRRSPERGWRHFLYGGEPGVAEVLRRSLEKHYPGIRVVGSWCPPFRSLTAEERREVTATINSCRPHIVWVGLSTPKQERWMAEMAPCLCVPVLVGVGAAFDFLSGRKAQAPRWIQRIGLEWLFRLLSEPRRLSRRYIVNNLCFVASLVRAGAGRQ